MKPVPTPGETRAMAKPANWDPAIHGECGTLSIRDGRDETSGGWTMTSTWQPDEIDLKALNAGAPIQLRIFGTNHPVVSVYVGDTK